MTRSWRRRIRPFLPPPVITGTAAMETAMGSRCETSPISTAMAAIDSMAARYAMRRRLRRDVQPAIGAPRLVHRLVGEAEELLAAPFGARAERDAEARGERLHPLVAVGLERGRNASRHRAGLRLRRLEQDQRELVPADPERGVRAAQDRDQRRRDPLQHRVARRVP